MDKFPASEVGCEHLKLDASKVYKSKRAVMLWQQEKRSRQESIELDNPHIDE